MTDNFKAFLEEASKDKEFIERLKKTSTAEAVIALAAEKGFQLTAEDLTPDEIPEGELSDDDLDAVAGGQRPGALQEINEKAEASAREAEVMKRNNWVVCGKF